MILVALDFGDGDLAGAKGWPWWQGQFSQARRWPVPAGKDPGEAFAFVAQHLRPQDAVCIGIYQRNKPDMLAEDVRLFEEALARQQG